MKPQRLSRTVIYENPWVNLYLDRVRFPGGTVIDQHHLLDFQSPAVISVVENEHGSILLVKVWRYTTGGCEWNLPGGGINPGEPVLAAAEREVLEETGYHSTGHRLIHSYYPMAGIANKQFHIVCCRAGEDSGTYDTSEVCQTSWAAWDEVEELMHSRVITDGFSLTALLFYARFYRDRSAQDPGGSNE